MKNILILLISPAVMFASCATKPQPEIPALSELNIYQPSILVIPAGQTVQTATGKYTPQTDEIWHSDKRYRDLERANY